MQAVEIAEERKNTQVTPYHLGSALLTANPAGFFPKLLARIGADASKLGAALDAKIGGLPRQDPAPDHVAPSSSLSRLLKAADGIRKKNGDSHISTAAVVQASLQDAELAKIYSDAGIKGDSVIATIAEVTGSRPVTSASSESTWEALAKFAVDLTASAEAGKLDPVIGRDEEIRRCIRILARRTKNNPVLTGAPGTGKTAIVEGLAQRIVAADVPEGLQKCRIWSLSMGSLLAGAKYRGGELMYCNCRHMPA